jgi:copper transport protein
MAGGVPLCSHVQQASAFAIDIQGLAMTGPLPVDAFVDDSGWLFLAGLDRVVFYVGLFIAGGGVMHHAVLAADLGRLSSSDLRRIEYAAGIAAAAAILGIGLQGGIQANGSWQSLFVLETWQLGMSTTLATSLLFAIGGLGLTLFSLRFRFVASTPAALAGAIVGVCSLALTGHAATTEPKWLSAPTLALHTLMVAFWLGSLWPLWAVLRREPAEIAIMTIQRFSRRAIPAVGILLTAGVVLAIAQVGSVGGILCTEYGNILTFKLVLVAFLLLLAGANRAWLTPAFAAGDAEARDGLQLTIIGEAVLALGILVATAMLGQAVPPRALLAGGNDALRLLSPTVCLFEVPQR